MFLGQVLKKMTNNILHNGIKVKRLEPALAESKEAVGMNIGMTPEGHVCKDWRRVTIPRVRGLVEIVLAENSDGRVMLDADGNCPTVRLLAVQDQCRLVEAINMLFSAAKLIT